MKNVIETAFGNFQVKKNGSPVEFKCTTQHLFTTSHNQIELYIIEVDRKGKDSIVCGFENPIFEQSLKETDTTLFVENEEFVLGLCSIEPKQHFDLKANEYGFTYQIENKIKLLLCSAVKEEKNEIQKAFNQEMQVLNVKEKTKYVIPILILFFVFSAFYLGCTFLIRDIDLSKIMFGIFGVFLVSCSFAFLFPSKKKSRTLFCIFFFLMIGICLYFVLYQTGRVAHHSCLIAGIIIVLMSCFFGLKSITNYQLQKRILPELFRLSNAFPKRLRKEWIELSKKLLVDDIKISNQVTPYKLNYESIEIPYRIELKEMNMTGFSSLQKQMLYCIYTRNNNGYIREKYIKKLLEMELPEWDYPFLLQISEDYVIEILDSVYDLLKNKEDKDLKAFVLENKEVCSKSYLKMISYWNQFYKEKTSFHSYVGRKLFRECFGYNKTLEKRKFTCACCNHNTIEGYFSDYYETQCPVCYWQNNVVQNTNPEKLGINSVSLKKARENYKQFGAFSKDYLLFVRKPLEKEKVSIDVDPIFKLLKLKLLEKGFVRKKGLYEYQGQCFRILYQNNFFLVEKLKNDLFEKRKEFKLETNSIELVDSVTSFLLKEVKKKKSKRLLKSEKNKIVEEEIRTWNPNSLENGEYTKEIKNITMKLSKLKTEKELQDHIEQVFQTTASEVSQKIWERIKG